MKENNTIPLIVGCNYHTTWQSDKAMRFILKGFDKRSATLTTRTTGKEFKTSIEDLVFINTWYNIKKAKDILKDQLSIVNKIEVKL